ncbi:MAG: alanine dehydrogenase [Promethearchaeota archaeon]
MIVGVPREIKAQEKRVSFTPNDVPELVEAGHQVIVERGAGLGSGFKDEQYVQGGARLVDSREEVFERADLVVKVKEPVEKELGLLRPGLALFTFLHLAANEPLTRKLLERRVTALAYETVEEGGRLPLLAPMSVIAGRMAPLVGGYFLMHQHGGMGKLLGGSFGIPHGRVGIIGGGVAGLAAAKVAAGMGAVVTLLEVNPARISYLEDVCPPSVSVIKSNKYSIRSLLPELDIVIGAVLVPGAKTPKLVTKEQLKTMKPGAVVVDVAIDQGGCFESSRPTTHRDPVYVEHGVVHYCVANMPGAYPLTSTLALTSATLPYVLAIANSEGDWASLVRSVPSLLPSFNTFDGNLTCEPVGRAFGIPAQKVELLL